MSDVLSPKSSLSELSKVHQTTTSNWYSDISCLREGVVKMSNPEAEKRVWRLFSVLKSDKYLHKGMTADELKIRIDMASDKEPGAITGELIKRMRNKEWNMLSKMIDKYLRDS